LSVFGGPGRLVYSTTHVLSTVVVTLLQSNLGMPLARRSTFATLLAVVALGVGLLASAPAAVSEPHLRSANASRGHIVVVMTYGELAPSKIVVATRLGTGRNGAFLPKNVRLTESLKLGPAVHGGGYRVRTRHTLPAGRYYVQVSALVLGVDCTPHKPCPTRWSNILRVRIPRR
jgi:hypothetical protein